MKSRWNEKTTADKTMLILRITASIAVVIFALLQLFDIWKDAINVAVPLIGVVILFQSIQEWNEHRSVAIFGFCSAVFICVCSIIVWFMK